MPAKVPRCAKMRALRQHFKEGQSIARLIPTAQVKDKERAWLRGFAGEGVGARLAPSHRAPVRLGAADC